MTHREIILNSLKLGDKCCNDIAKEITAKEVFVGLGNYRYRMKNLNSSLSGTLNRMVKRGELEICDNKRGPKGSKVYKIK